MPTTRDPKPTPHLRMPRATEGEQQPDHGEHGSRIQHEAAEAERGQLKQAEATLKLQARVLENMTEGVSVANEQGVIVYTNPAEDRMFGYARGELLGQHVTVQNDYASEENQRIVSEVIAVLKRHGEWTGEWANRKKDGTRFTTRARITALELDGQPHWVCVQQDITDQVEARRRADRLAATLVAHERQLRLITDSIPALVAYVGTDERYQFCNRSYLSWFGLDPDQLVGKHLSEVLGVPNYRAIEPSVKRALSGEIVRYERELLIADGGRRYVQGTYVPDKDERGCTRGFVALAQDLTDRRRAEMAMEAERTRLHEILMQAPASISIRSGPDHVFTLVNPILQRTVGERPLLGKPTREALPELAETRELEALARVYATGDPISLNEIRVPLRDGDGRTFEHFFNVTYQALRDADGAIDSVVSFAMDVTEQVAARELAESANRAKDEFLAMLGHELRNPMAPILTALELMKMRDGRAFAKERAIIERQVKHVVRLVDDLLDVSRMTRGMASIERQRVDLAAAIANALELASPLLEQARHRLSVQVAEGLFVEGDRTRLSQIFSNLLTNAAKYTPPGGSISVIADRVDSGARVRVRDSGIGIRPEILPKIFELFVQERQTLDRSEGGLGLGLAIVRSLVSLHGGSVEVSSEGEGHGSEFTVLLPLAPLPDDREPAAAAQPADAPVSARRVLVVDDNADAAELLGEALGDLGHTVRVAHDGPSALKMLETFVPDIALLDIGLPVMDGYELARRIRADPRYRATHLVAVTGYGDSKSRQAARVAGFDAHMVKPIDFVMLERVLAK